MSEKAGEKRLNGPHRPSVLREEVIESWCVLRLLCGRKGGIGRKTKSTLYITSPKFPCREWRMC